ncbi:hypothetical protein C6P42_001940, partial [Pichia californica]
MSNAAIDEFLNTKFPTVDSLNSVDTVIHEIENTISNTNKGNDNNNKEIMDISKANSFLEILRGYVKNPTDESLYLIEELINKYGNIPAITYSKELVEQKLKLIKESQIRKDFVIILDKLNDFEIFELNDLSNIESSYDEKVQVVNKISEFRTDIDNFKKYSNSNSNSNYFHIDIDINKLYSELESKLYEIINNKLCDTFKKSLILKIDNWDSEKENIKVIDSTAISEFNLLLNLQLKSASHSTFIAGSENITFWAIDCLIAKFQNKFIFHFEGNGETNRIDKPEFAFSYLVGYLRKNIDHAKYLFASNFAKCCKKNGDDILGSFSTWFITSTLIPLRRKFTKEISLLLETNNSSLLSHFVTEIKKFDEEIEQEFAFIPLKGQEWGGLTNDLILSRDIVWNAWLQNEKDFVNKRFEEIVEMDDAFLIDTDIVENGKTKPTKSANNLKNLLENITTNYDSLPLKYQLKFLSEVQLKLLNFYFDTLKKGVSALKTIKNVEIDGVSTLERICRIWCSSQYIIEMMKKWSNEIIFIELWKSLNTDNNTETTFFESVINGYEREILKTIPSLLTKYFERQLNRTMKGYFEDNNEWILTTEKPEKDDELEFVIQTLSTDQRYLQNTVSFITFNNWKLLISNIVATYFEKNIAVVNNFNSFGADKL